MNNLPWKNEKEFYNLHSKDIFSRFPFYHVSMVGKTKEKFLDYIVHKARINSTSKVVDLGCGSGYVVDTLSEFCECEGISTSQECIYQYTSKYPKGRFKVANMEDYYSSNVTHFLTLESLGYSDLSRTFKNVYNNLQKDGIFYVKDLIKLSKESAKEKGNRKYWEHYWCYNSFSVLEIITVAYTVGFKLLEFNDITDKINSSMFRETLKFNRVPFLLPFPKVNFLLAADFLFIK